MAQQRLLRLTRHEASEAQVAEAHRIFGSDLEIVTISETVPDAARVRQLVEANAATVLEAVLPLPLLAEVLNPRSGITVPVVRAVMNREVDASGAATFTFSHYERIVKVEVITERL